MDLTTRCPHCGTTFAASLEQLQLRKGYIRCVQCAHIFDGYEAVVPAASTGIEPDALQPRSPAAPIPQEKLAAHSVPPQPPASATPTPMPSVVRARREFTISDRDPVDRQDEPLWTVSPAASKATASDHAVIDLDRVALDPDRARRDPDRTSHTRRDPDHGNIGHAPVLTDNEHVMLGSQEQDAAAHYAQMWRTSNDDSPSSWWGSLIRLVWVAVIAAGIIVFALQLAYVFRVQIAENIPALRPTLERMCTALDCTVPYSRQIDMIVITQSSLQQDPGEGDDGSDEVLLQFTLRNVHDGPQEWPTLVLDLKDFSGALIARKHLSKDDYLPADSVDAPFPANSERMVALPLTMQGLQVNGYQLTAFFP